MKKFKKILTATTASLLCLSSLTALSGNAIWTPPITNNETAIIENLIQGYNSFFDSETVALDKERLFSEDNSMLCFSDNFEICSLVSSPRMFEVCTDDMSREQIEEIVQSYYPNFVVKKWGGDTFIILDYDSVPLDGIMDTVEDAEVIYNALSEAAEIKSCKFYGNKIEPQFGGLPGYRYVVDAEDEQDVPAILQEYLDEKGFDFKVTIGTKEKELDGTMIRRCYLEATRKVMAQEVADVHTAIYNDLGFGFIGYGCYETSFASEPLDLCKTDGDSNTDGVLGIADATLILQYLTNKDEYSLTEQGIYNADLDKDGITANDAFVIQQILAERGEV